MIKTKIKYEVMKVMNSDKIFHITISLKEE